MRKKIKKERIDAAQNHEKMPTELKSAENAKCAFSTDVNSKQIPNETIKTEDIYTKYGPYTSELQEDNVIHPEPTSNNNHTRNTRNRGFYIPTYTMVKPYECNICHKRYLCTNAMKQHIRKLHSAVKQHECSVCHKCFNTRSQLKHHTDVVHTKNKVYNCKICSKELSTRYNLEKHCMRHAGQHFCSICHKTFAWKRQLTDHLLLHAGKVTEVDRSTTYACHICRKEFSKQSQLVMHLEMHKRMTVLRQSNNNSQNKRYECKICHKGFSRITLLKIHMSLHGRQMPAVKANAEEKEIETVRCNISLPLTVYIPAVEKVYPCEVCHKRFLLKTALRVHLQEHSTSLITNN